MSFMTFGISSSFSSQISRPPLLGSPTEIIGTKVTGSSSQINLSWTAPTNNGGFPITNYTYNYQYYDISNNVWSNYGSLFYVGSSTTSTTVTGLFADTSYTFQVSAINSKGISSPATSSVVRTNKWILTLISNSVVNVAGKHWVKNASDVTGNKLVVAANGDHIYTSSDSGVNWTNRTTTLDWKWWNSICSNSNGNILAASSDYIYTSSDSGNTWIQKTGSGNRAWNGISLSSNGNLLVACVDGGFIYTSSDLGNNWNVRATTLGSKNWAGICSNNEGTRVVAAVRNDYIYVSSDSGANWTQKISSGSRDWYDVILLGTNLIFAYTAWEGIYKSSNLGDTWDNILPQSYGQICFDLASSSDGTRLVAVIRGGYIYTSINSGATWVEQTHLTNTGDWKNISSSSDGTKLFYSISGGKLYTIR